jgi:hypothetical protein
VPDADVVISWSFAPVPRNVRDAFQRSTVFLELPTPAGRKYGDQLRNLGWPTPVRGILKRYAPGLTPLRVASLGFSESCSGVLGLLKSGDGARIDAAVAIDGIHTAPAKEPNAVALQPWVSFATMAAAAERLCVITHSSIQPPYASTTATAAQIWERATGSDKLVDFPAVRGIEAAPTTIRVGSPPAARPYTVEYPRPAQQLPRRLNGLIVLGYDNVDPAGYADHIYQVRVVLPIIVGRFLAARWNAIDPHDPAATCYVA